MYVYMYIYIYICIYIYMCKVFFFTIISNECQYLSVKENK